MRVRFVKNVDCDLYDRKLDETYPKYYQRWDEISVDSIEDIDSHANLVLSNGDTALDIPKNSFIKIFSSVLP